MKRLDNGKLVFEFGCHNENLYATKIINATGGADRLLLFKIDEVRRLVVEAMNLAVSLHVEPSVCKPPSIEVDSEAETILGLK